MSKRCTLKFAFNLYVFPRYTWHGMDTWIWDLRLVFTRMWCVTRFGRPIDPNEVSTTLILFYVLCLWISGTWQMGPNTIIIRCIKRLHLQIVYAVHVYDELMMIIIWLYVESKPTAGGICVCIGLDDIVMHAQQMLILYKTALVLMYLIEILTLNIASITNTKVDLIKRWLGLLKPSSDLQYCV